jgi:formylmethanofuran dehydrogenase subunit B
MPASRRGGAPAPSQVGHVTCLGCGCACDDIILSLSGGRIERAERACPLGVAWFADGQVPDRVLVDGAPAELDRALEQAADLLREAQGRLLVVLGADITTAAYGSALALADALGAATDGLVSEPAGAGILAGQRRGRATATLGELRNRADLVVYWGVDPDVRYPRYRSRYLAVPKALHLGAGAPDRTVVSVGIGRDAGPAEADLRIALDPAQEVPALAELRAGLRGRRLGVTGLPPALADLATRLTQARYVAIVHEGEPSDEQRSPERVEALIALTQTLNTPTRAALSTLRAGGNRNGAEAVSTWQTGFPFAVDFSRGAPRYRPERRIGGPAAGAAPAAALVAGAADGLPERLENALRRVPTVTIGPRASAAPYPTRVAIDTGVAGIHEAGIAYRMDDIPLPVQASLAGPRSADETLRRLLTRIRATAGAIR